MNILKCTVIIFVYLFLIGCTADDDPHQVIPPYDLQVANKSTIDIYPVLSDPNNGIKDDFGGVAKGTSSTKGFGPFALSKHIVVTWEEGLSETDYTTDIYTHKILPLDPKVKRVSFVYEGNKIWLVIGLDRDENEIVRLEGIPRTKTSKRRGYPEP